MARLVETLQDGPPEQLVAPGPTYLRRHLDWPIVQTPEKQDADRLEFVEARNLTYHYSETGRGIKQINLNLPRGSFTVIAGRVGSGKTTLLRALSGLLPAEGEIFWNGRPVADPGSFFCPATQCVYGSGLTLV